MYIYVSKLRFVPYLRRRPLMLCSFSWIGINNFAKGNLVVQYSPKIMHAQEVAREVAQEVLAPQEHASRRKTQKCLVFAV